MRTEPRDGRHPVTSPMTTPASAGGPEFVPTPRGGVATPGPRSESDTDDRNFIKGSDESDNMSPLDDDEDYQPGDSEFEDSDDNGEDEEERIDKYTTEELIRAAEEAAY